MIRFENWLDNFLCKTRKNPCPKTCVLEALVQLPSSSSGPIKISESRRHMYLGPSTQILHLLLQHGLELSNLCSNEPCAHWSRLNHTSVFASGSRLIFIRFCGCCCLLVCFILLCFRQGLLGRLGWPDTCRSPPASELKGVHHHTSLTCGLKTENMEVEAGKHRWVQSPCQCRTEPHGRANIKAYKLDSRVSSPAAVLRCRTRMNCTFIKPGSLACHASRFVSFHSPLLS